MRKKVKEPRSKAIRFQHAEEAEQVTANAQNCGLETLSTGQLASSFPQGNENKAAG
jgi:hypothetical protein